MSDLPKMLAEFHRAISHPSTDELWIRRILHEEEHDELVDAIDALRESGDLTAADLRMDVARELADVVYVAYGTAHALRIDLDAALREVHRANMQKAHGPRREDGKALKPEGFIPPDLRASVSDREGRP